MAALTLRHNRYWAKIRVPRERQPDYDGKQFLYHNTRTGDKRLAKVEADAWESMLRLEWAQTVDGPEPEKASLRAAYQRTRELAETGEYKVEMLGEPDSTALGIEFELERLADKRETGRITELDEYKLAGLQDALRGRRGQKLPKRLELEPDWNELAQEYMRSWEAQKGLNLLPDLEATFGNSTVGMSDRTLNRHIATLKSLWTWAHDREYCEGNNPFAGFHRKIVEGRNSAGYQAWQDSDLQLIWSKPPKRIDLQEVMVVAMFTGMRLDEIASLTWEQIKREDEIDYIEVRAAKTQAGNRQVPLHAALSWLAKRKPKGGTGRVWPKFNPEGPAKKAGADAGNDFSRYKIGLGFTDRTKTFHSFRKTVTKQMERAGVRENEWAEIIGHEKGFTFKTYNPDGLALSHKAAIIAKIGYPNLKSPHFE